MKSQQSEKESSNSLSTINAGNSGRKGKTLPAVPVLQNRSIIQKVADEREEELLQEKFVTQLKGSEVAITDPLLEEKNDKIGNAAIQSKSPEEEKLPVQKKENKTGLPDNLKEGVENLAGIAMDDVKVHYNSDKPAQLQALAYAQGTDIHVGPGQEKHLPHEAWHVVQQKQGRVRSTLQLEEGVQVNDDKSLEQEADRMGEKIVMNKSSKVSQFKRLKASDAILQMVQMVQMVACMYKGVLFDLEESGDEKAFFNDTKAYVKKWYTDKLDLIYGELTEKYELYDDGIQKLLLLLLAFAVFINACEKGFLNDVAPTNSALPEQVYASTDAVRAYFNGIYRTMRSQWQNSDVSAGGETDVWGYNSINLARDVKGMDIIMPYNTWYYFDYQNQNREPTYRRTRFTWYFFYELINQVNTLIAGVQNSKTIIEADKPPLIAEARALRANYYFELVREFQFTYLKDPNAPGVPVYTVPTVDTNLEGKPRGTVQDVYNQINDDIQFAVQNLTTDRNQKSQVNLNVAWGLAARIYLEQGKWADAEAAAQNAREGVNLDPAGYPNNYNGLTSSEVIWGFPQTLQSGGQTLYYGTPSSFFEQTGNGYDGFWMSRELVDHFTPTDVRNTFYVYDPDSTAADYVATNKFGTGSGQPVDLLSGQTVELKMIDFNESLNMMRIGEMYLVEAEAKARQGKDADADKVLFELQSNRDPNAVQSHNTGQALIKEILLERRKELYGELGIDWLDAKRLQLPIDRTKSNHPTPNDYIIPANDPAFNLKIPQSEIQANRAMSPADQNP